MTTDQLALELSPLVVPEPDATLTLDERFTQFRAANSWVGRTLLALIDEAIAHGQDSRYARWAIQQRPDLEPYIETRALRAA